MGMGIAKLISREWEWEQEWLDGNGRELKLHISHFQLEEEKQPVSGATSAFPGTSAYSDSELAEYVNPNGNGSGRKWE